MFTVLLNLLLATLLLSPCAAFCNHSSGSAICTQRKSVHLNSSRRSFITTSASTILGSAVMTSIVLPDNVAHALPLITVAEFEQILKDSGKIDGF